MSNHTEMYKGNNGGVPPSTLKSLLKCLLIGFGDLVVNQMNMPAALGDLGGCCHLVPCLSGCIYAYIDYFVPSPSPLGKRRGREGASHRYL